MKYTEKQFGWIAVIPFPGILIFLFIAYYYQWGSRPIPFLFYLILSIVFLFSGLLFYEMRICLDAETILITYGIRLIRKRIIIAEIDQVKTVKNKWYYGLGIRKIKKGWLYNIQGLQAVELSLRDSDSIIRIGTKDNENLKREIEKRLHQPPGNL